MSEPVEIFDAKSRPLYVAPSRLSFHYDKGDLNLSVTAYRLLGGEKVNSVAILKIGNGYYLTCADATPTGWILRKKSKRWSASHNTVQITNKANVRHLMQIWGHGPGEVLRVPLTRNPIQVDTPPDPALYPYPLYRLMLDQATIKPTP